MPDHTGIEWTDATWNPVTGCTRAPVVDSDTTRRDPFAVRLWPERLDQPGGWLEPRMIFVNSMSDLFHVDVPATVRFLSCEPLIGPLTLDLVDIHWVIAGGESGPVRRPMKPEWVVAIRNQCQAAGIPFFFKQWGGRTPKAGGRELEGELWDQMPRAASG